MGRITAFFVFALAIGSAVADEYKVVNARPSRLLAAMAGLDPKKGGLLYEMVGVQGQIIPVGLKVKADDERSVLIFEGNQKDKESFQQTVKLFDVKPRDIEAKISFYVPLEKYQTSVTTKVRNNSAWKVTDQSANLSLSILPRINEDGTITVTFSVGDGQEGRNMVVRTKNGQTVELTLDGLTGFRVRNVEPESKKDPNVPTMKLTFKIVED
jgi:hypothetical protein